MSPKLLNSLCCCIRNSDSYKKSRSDTSSERRRQTNGSTDGADGFSAIPHHSVICQAQQGPPAKLSLRASLAGGDRHTAGRASQQLPSAADAEQRRVNSPLPTGQSQPLGVGAKRLASRSAAPGAREDGAGLLPKPHAHEHHKKCLIVDLDETLVHSSFKPVKNADFIIPVEIDNVVHRVYVLKRPYTDEFLERVGALFECVLFTASLSKYADPVADLLDKRGTFRARLFREACVFFEGNYVKDLDKLGRAIEQVLIIDNSPASYAFHPENAIPIRTWFDDPHDRELLEMLPLLEQLAASDNIYSVLRSFGGAEPGGVFGFSGAPSPPGGGSATLASSIFSSPTPSSILPPPRAPAYSESAGPTSNTAADNNNGHTSHTGSSATLGTATTVFVNSPALQGPTGPGNPISSSARRPLTQAEVHQQRRGGGAGEVAHSEQQQHGAAVRSGY